MPPPQHMRGVGDIIATQTGPPTDTWKWQQYKHDLNIWLCTMHKETNKHRWPEERLLGAILFHIRLFQIWTMVYTLFVRTTILNCMLSHIRETNHWNKANTTNHHDEITCDTHSLCHSDVRKVQWLERHAVQTAVRRSVEWDKVGRRRMTTLYSSVQLH
jgi:hypothetical protein